MMQSVFLVLISFLVVAAFASSLKVLPILAGRPVSTCVRLLFWLGLGLTGYAGMAAEENPGRPNVILILSDDQGAWTLNSAGSSELQTPNLNRLAAEGVTFENSFVATPVCSPSRMTLFTGKMPSSHGLQFHLLGENDEASRSMLAKHTAFTDILAANGYVVGLSGKWHMGGDLYPQSGFSYWRVIHGTTYRDPEVVMDGRREPVAGFKTDLEADYALEFIEQYKDQPFFLYWAANAPHRDYDFQPEVDRAPYRHSDFPSFPREPVHPWQNPNPQLVANLGNEESMTSYAALVTGLDRNIGRLLDRLRELDLLDNTLIVFSSDNGYNAGHHGLWGKGSGSVPFNLFEESVRVPLIWWRPGHIPAGKRVAHYVANYDFFPTLLDYLGLEADHDPQRIGRSYAPMIRGESIAWTNEVFFEYAYMRGVRTETEKYLERTVDWPGEYYDLVADPEEKRNLMEDPQRGGERRKLDDLLQGFFREIQAPPLAAWRSTTTQEIPFYSTERLRWYPWNSWQGARSNEP